MMAYTVWTQMIPYTVHELLIWCLASPKQDYRGVPITQGLPV